jgi:hypothetical protein
MHEAINKMAKEYCNLFSMCEDQDVWDLVDFVKHCEEAMNALEELSK